MQLQERFWNWYAPNAVERSHGRSEFPRDVAMFSLHDPQAGNVMVYFTPNAAEFAATVEAVEPSPAPLPDKYLELNVGDQLAWKLIADPGKPAPAEA